MDAEKNRQAHCVSLQVIYPAAALSALKRVPVVAKELQIDMDISYAQAERTETAMTCDNIPQKRKAPPTNAWFLPGITPALFGTTRWKQFH
jgi:hypothetical protein